MGFLCLLTTALRPLQGMCRCVFVLSLTSALWSPLSLCMFILAPVLPPPYSFLMSLKRLPLSQSVWIVPLWRDEGTGDWKTGLGRLLNVEDRHSDVWFIFKIACRRKQGENTPNCAHGVLGGWRVRGIQVQGVWGKSATHWATVPLFVICVFLPLWIYWFHS